MTSVEKTLLGCGITIVIAVLLSLGSCGLLIYKRAVNFPEYAKREQVYPANQEIIDQVNAIIAGGDSFPAIQQRLAAVNWPDKVVYVYIKEDDAVTGFDKQRTTKAQDVEVFKRYPWSGHSSFSMNGSGYGHLDTDNGRKNIVIIDNSQLNAKQEPIHYLIYVELQN